MILSILQHTPAWVFVLFIALVALGVSRLRANTIGVRQLLILPIAMTGFSLFGLTQACGIGLVPLAAWSVAFAAMLAVAALRPTNPAVQYSPATHSIRVPGSWLPLALMMTIFFLRYAVAVVLAMHPALHGETAFVAVVAALYGLSSGSFAARALLTWRSAFAARTTDPTFAAA
jgi:hypothetical protein